MTTDTQPMAPTDAEIEALGHRMCWRYTPAANQFRGSTHTFNRTTLLNFARAVLARWGEQQVPAGYALVPVEVRNLYDFMCTAFVPVTGQHDQIAISLDLAKAAMLSAAPQPVVREPLTHAQAKALVSKYGNDPLHLVHQVEVAHGITGGQHGTE